MSSTTSTSSLKSGTLSQILNSQNIGSALTLTKSIFRLKKMETIFCRKRPIPKPVRELTLECRNSIAWQKKPLSQTIHVLSSHKIGVYDLINELPSFPRPSISYIYRLGYISYPAWTHSCRVSEEYSLLEATTHLNFNKVTEKTELVLYVGVPCMLICAIFIRCLYIVRNIFEIRSKK